MRRALQISDGELSGLCDTAFSKIVYLIIAAAARRSADRARGAQAPGAAPAAPSSTTVRSRARQPGRTLTCRSSWDTSPPEGGAALDRAIEEAKVRNDGSSWSTRAGATRSSTSGTRPTGLGLRRTAPHRLRRRARGEPAGRGEDPGDQILNLAQETNAELIVIGLRRRTPVGKLIMGSQAQTILLEAECPVLAVKAPTS